MKKFIYLASLIVLFSACSKHAALSNIFDCEIETLKDTKKVTDFKKNFTLNISKNWKTAFYFDEFQSEMFTADTIKQLSETFILDASFNLGNLNFDSDFYKKTDSILHKNSFQKINDGTISFQSKPAYWYLLKGRKKGFTYHQFNLMVIISNNTYFKAFTEIYGDENINDRICTSITILEKIEFL